MKNSRKLEKRRKKGYKPKNDFALINKMMKSKDSRGNVIEYDNDLNFTK